jgi:hypothetical protein
MKPLNEMNAQEMRSMNAKMLVTCCVLPTVADFFEDISIPKEAEKIVNELTDLIRELDNVMINSEKDKKKRIDLMEQQVYIQRSFRDWIIQQFGLAQKDIKKIPSAIAE